MGCSSRTRASAILGRKIGNVRTYTKSKLSHFWTEWHVVRTSVVVQSEDDVHLEDKDEHREKMRGPRPGSKRKPEPSKEMSKRAMPRTPWLLHNKVAVDACWSCS